MTTWRPATTVIRRNLIGFNEYYYMTVCLEMPHDLCDPIQALSRGGVQRVLQEELSPQYGEGHGQGAGGGLQDAAGEDLRQQLR